MRLSASGLDRAESCPGSLALVQRPHSSADSESGNSIHHFLDRAAKVGRALALGEIEDAEFADKCAAIDLDSIPAGAESEVALAYDPEEDKAERLILDGHRAYPEDGRIYGTADRVGRTPSGVWIGDYKTGKPGMRARDALQLRFLALAASRVTSTDEAEVAMLYLRHDGKWMPDRAQLDAFDLEETREQLLSIRARGREAMKVVDLGGLPQLVPGFHCEHCAAASDCPVIERQQQALQLRDPESLTEWVASLPLDRAGALAEQAITVSKIADKARSAFNALAERCECGHSPDDHNHGKGRCVEPGCECGSYVPALPDGLPLPSGRVLKRVQWGATITSDAAKEELAALKTDLRERGEITSGKTWQTRVMGKAKK